MTTALDIITRAYRKISVGGMGETLDAEMSREGLDALNAMIHGWRLRGVDTYFTDLDMADAMPLGQEFDEGIVYNLASRLSPDYTAPAAFNPEDWFRGIQAAYMVIADVAIPSPLRRMPSTYAPRKQSRY